MRLGSLPAWLQAALAIVVLDGWLYAWHRLNHRLPWLWRFHRMHHADPHMDATTALRFHPGELLLASALRLPVIALLGIEVWHLLLYEILILAITLFHHANISLGRWESPLSRLVVTPGLHKIHHSRWRPETDSNFSTLFSVWDRLFSTLRERADPALLRLGLDEFDDPRWQTLGGQLRTPLRNPHRH